jgi:hypothetical protein
MATIDIPTVPHAQTAQERMQELRRWREQIPNFVIPTTVDATRRLSSAASVPPEFIELTNLAISNHTSVVRTEGATPEQVRSLVSYADAYGPLADELEALATFIRYSTTAARNRAGTEALMTYALAQRLAKLPETAALKPHVADMRRALRRGRRPSPETTARKAAERAARAAAKAAANTAADAATDPATEQTS